MTSQMPALAFSSSWARLASFRSSPQSQDCCARHFTTPRWRRSHARVLMQMEANGKSEQPKRQETHISAAFANQAIHDAISYCGGGVLAVARVCALGFCDAFQQCYSLEDISDVFITCGPGFNGVIGLQAAVELKRRGYKPAVYAVGESKFTSFRSICNEAGIDLYDFIPSTVEFYFDIMVDALLGTGFDGGDIRQQYWTVFEMLVSTRLAIVSVDVPSGWDLAKGPRGIDVTAGTFIKPEVLVSMGAPKLGSKMFAGGYHFLAGRHLPQSYFLENGISVPAFPGEEANCVLISSNPFRFQGGNGEKYGRPGQFNATLYTKNPTREWVDVEESDDLWDELD